MVRKIALYLFVGTLLLAMPTQVNAYEVYDKGNISSTYTDIFRDILNKCPPDSDYVLFRSSNYTYTMIVGDLEYDGFDFTGQNCKDYTLQYNNSVGANTYAFDCHDISSFALSSDVYLVYSNLGDFPTLIERGSVFEYSLLYIFIIFSICCLVRPLFIFVQRFRNGN